MVEKYYFISFQNYEGKLQATHLDWIFEGRKPVTSEDSNMCQVGNSELQEVVYLRIYFP